MRLDGDKFIEKYIEYAIEIDKNLKKGNSRINNKYAKKLNKLNNQCRNEEYYINGLNKLMDNNDLGVASIAAADSIRNKANMEKAIQTLERISKTEGIGLTAFSAKWALKRWREEGTLG